MTQVQVLMLVPYIMCGIVLTGVICVNHLSFNKFLNKVRTGTAVAMTIGVFISWPLICLAFISRALIVMVQHILLDLRNLKGFEKAKPANYEKAINELIQMNPAAALISNNKDIRVRAESILGKNK